MNSEVPKLMQYKNEIGVLLACSKRDDPAALADKITPLLTADFDWNFLYRVSYRNAVFPLVFTNLLKAKPDVQVSSAVPDVVSQLRDHIELNMFLTSQIFRIVRVMRAKDIPVLPFKGPLLSMQAYGNATVRMFGDLDLLVQPKHLDDATRLLQESGYRPLTSASWLKKSTWYISRQKDVHFVDETGRAVLELHWKLSGSHFGLPKEINRLWDRLESITLAGMEVPNLSFNDLLIYLCLHGSRHSWERFGWICDVYYLLTSRDEIDWDVVLAESKSLGCENVVALSLKLVNELFGYQIPDTFAETMDRTRVYDEIAGEVRQRIFSPENVQVEIGDRYTYHLKLKERRLDKWKLHVHYILWYLRIILKPNQMDRDALHLPRLLHPAYFVTRPIRLLYTNLLRPEEKPDENTQSVARKQNAS